MIYVIKGRSVSTQKLSESLSKVTVTDKTPYMFKMLANYKPPIKKSEYLDLINLTKTFSIPLIKDVKEGYS